MDGGRVPDGLTLGSNAPHPHQVTEDDLERTAASRHQRATGHRPLVGRPDIDGAPRGSVRGHGGAELRDEHDRSDVGLPQPGMPVRAAPTDDQDQSRSRGVAPGCEAGEAAEELLGRTGTAVARRCNPGRPSPGHVAHRVDVRLATRRARGVAMAVRRHRFRRAEHRRRRARRSKSTTSTSGKHRRRHRVATAESDCTPCWLQHCSDIAAT